MDGLKLIRYGIRKHVLFFFRFGMPHIVHSDQGPNFANALIQEMCGMLCIKKTRTPPYHYQSDRLVENLNKKLLDLAINV